MPKRAMAAVAALLLASTAGACTIEVEPDPIDPVDRDGEPMKEGPGLFSGEEGSFVIIRR